MNSPPFPTKPLSFGGVITRSTQASQSENNIYFVDATYLSVLDELKMKSFGGYLLALSSITLLNVYAVRGATTSSPTIRLFQTDGDNKILKVINAASNTESILENIESIRLECTADYPVQWVYNGNGVPLMESRIMANSAVEYRASAYVNKLTERHTGKYKCQSTETPDILSYFYIYVPGSALFSASTGKELEIGSNSVQIPCTVSSPRIAVYLQKPVGAPLSNQAEYDPRRGFYFQVAEMKKAVGVYLCKASYRGATNVLEYEVKILLNSSSLVDDEPVNISPESPCNPPCATNAKCVFTNGDSRCECLEPFQGDGYRTCERKTRPRGECADHSDCSDNLSCFVDSVCRDPCTNSAHGLECGTNAICKTVDHQPTCACPGGSYGDPMRECSGVQGDQPPSRRKPTTPRTTSSKCDCGPDCECICRTDKDCDKGHVCNGTRCQDPCEKLCGSNAICTAVQGTGLCSCPKGYRGDPWKSCSRIGSEPIQTPDDEPTGTCLSDKDCPLKYTCDAHKCIDPCDKCVPNASCDLFDGGSKPKCRCPEGYTGDGTISCTPDLNFEVSSVKYSTEEKTACSDVSCGTHGECRIYDGLPKCNCQNGYVGSPPNCKAECKALRCVVRNIRRNPLPVFGSSFISIILIGTYPLTNLRILQSLPHRVKPEAVETHLQM
ncbi:unnamed protein product [Allacma fusca]|uniref:EGF-like domain-containing protein n=1 Tax=Allacma fusca TaxID=39272 RepID=A0A8J2KSG1_9HEXA|nr:unnamed protein product [Allacma fusca]